MDNRPKWSEYFLSIARAVSLRSDCTRSQVGAVIVDRNNRICSTGYVGVGSGEPGCLDGACPRGRMTVEECARYGSYDNCVSTHAEQNAIYYSDRSRHEGGTIYVTREPCTMCYKAIKGSGISLAVFLNDDKVSWSNTDMTIWRSPIALDVE